MPLTHLVYCHARLRSHCASFGLLAEPPAIAAVEFPEVLSAAVLLHDTLALHKQPSNLLVVRLYHFSWIM